MLLTGCEIATDDIVDCEEVEEAGDWGSLVACPMHCGFAVLEVGATDRKDRSCRVRRLIGGFCVDGGIATRNALCFRLND